jgi:hypothetical protein
MEDMDHKLVCSTCLVKSDVKLVIMHHFGGRPALGHLAMKKPKNIRRVTSQVSQQCDAMGYVQPSFISCATAVAYHSVILSIIGNTSDLTINLQFL